MSNTLNLGRDLYLKGRIGWKGLKKDEYLNFSDYKIINATALEDGFIDWNNCGYITKERFEESPEIMLQENDILISKDGTLGKIGFVKNMNVPCSVASGVFVLRNTAQDKVDFDYLYYILTSHIFKDFISRNKAEGSTINHLYQRDLENFEIELPSLDVQKKVGSFLSNIDKKIQNNKKQIETLENLAKTIYDYWFVQFDFPNEEGKPYKSSGGKMVWNKELKREIPEGWKVVKFEKIAKFLKGKIPTNLYDNSDGMSPYITIDVACGGIPLYCSRDDMVICEGETIMVMDGAASGDVYIGEKGVLGSTLSKLVPYEDDISNSLIFLILKHMQSIYKRANVGSTVPHANKHYINQLYIALPIECKQYSNYFDMFYSKIIIQRENIRELEKIKQFVLPLLMNGQVSIR